MLNDETARIIADVIAPALRAAREKHPRFARDAEHAGKVVLSEMLEWQAQAVLADDSANRRKKAEAEAIDVIVVMLRWLAKDYGDATARNAHVEESTNVDSKEDLRQAMEAE